MSLVDDTYCQLCERFITKEQWNNHLYSSRHLHEEMNGYTPAYVRVFHKGNWLVLKILYLKRHFWKMFFATRDIKEVDEFWLTYFMMTTVMKDYFLE